jgi:hypothetical protein
MVHSLAEHRSPGGLAAAMARHPAAAGRTVGAARRPSFADLVGLLTGPWRVGDPEGFAAAMTGAPLLAGLPVLDLSAGTTTGALDPWSARLLAGLQTAVGRAGVRPGLAVDWVAGRHAGHLFVEARAQAPAGPEGPELFVVAHLVEHLGADGRRRPALGEHSWAVLVVGDGAGGVAGVLRATLSCPAGVRCCPTPAPWARLPLASLRDRLLAPALGAEPAARPPSGPRPEAVVLPFARGATHRSVEP